MENRKLENAVGIILDLRTELTTPTINHNEIETRGRSLKFRRRLMNEAGMTGFEAKLTYDCALMYYERQRGLQ